MFGFPSLAQANQMLAEKKARDALGPTRFAQIQEEGRRAGEASFAAHVAMVEKLNRLPVGSPWESAAEREAFLKVTETGRAVLAKEAAARGETFFAKDGYISEMSERADREEGFASPENKRAYYQSFAGGRDFLAAQARKDGFARGNDLQDLSPERRRMHEELLREQDAEVIYLLVGDKKRKFRRDRFTGLLSPM